MDTEPPHVLSRSMGRVPTWVLPPPPPPPSLVTLNLHQHHLHTTSTHLLCEPQLVGAELVAVEGGQVGEHLPGERLVQLQHLGEVEAALMEKGKEVSEVAEVTGL